MLERLNPTLQEPKRGATGVVVAAASLSSGIRVSIAIQFSSQVLPPSSEKDCSKR